MRPRVPACTLLFATALLNQQPPTLAAVAHTALSVRAGGNPVTLPASTALLPAINLQVGTAAFFARVATAELVSPTNLEFTLTDAVTVPSGPSPAVASTGPHEALLQFNATTPVRAILQLRWAGSSTAPLQGSSNARVDVNNDGSFEFDSANTTSLDLPLQFGPGALLVRTATGCAMINALQNGGAFAGGSASGAITVRLVPDAGVSSQTYAPGCGGPPLSARPNFGNGADLLATGLNRPNVVGLLAIGFAPQSLTLPVAPFCTLDTTIAAIMRLAPDASGTAIVPLVVPAGVRPLGFRAQAAAFVALPPSLVTGPALLVQCQ